MKDKPGGAGSLRGSAEPSHEERMKDKPGGAVSLRGSAEPSHEENTACKQCCG